MDDFFDSSNVGIKTLSLPTIDKNLDVSIEGCLILGLKSKIQKNSSEQKDVTMIYKNKEYQCSSAITEYFIKSSLENDRFELNFSNFVDVNKDDNDYESANDSNGKLNDKKTNNNKSDDSNNTNEKQSDNNNDENNIDSENDSSQENLSDEELFVLSIFLKFFNGEPVVIKEANVKYMSFISKEENLNIPCFQKICMIFDKFYDIYYKMDPIADIQYDIINIDDLIGIRNKKSEISQTNSVDFLDQEVEADDSISAISSFGSLLFSDSISPSLSVEFFEKINEVVDDIVDRIATEPTLANDIILIYNILIKASIYRPENIQFYVKIIRKLDDPQPQGKGIKIINVIRKLYLHNINQSTDFFVLHEMMLGGIFTIKEILDVVKESTSLEFKIWFAPYIEAAEEERKKQLNNNDNTNNDLDDDNGYGNVIQDIEDRIYSISEPEKRQFKVHFFSAIRENNWALHKILARQGANHTSVARAIRRDDVKKLQKILAFDPKASVNDVIKWSAFDHIQYLMNKPTLIQYAAFYGAVKCFKYLMLNEARLDTKDGNNQYLINYAVAGGNTEIVRICIQQKVPTISVLSPACLFYRFDLLDWIIENVFPTIKPFNFKRNALQNAFLNSLESFNFISIMKLFQFIDESALYKSAAVDNELVLSIFNLFHFSREDKAYMLICSTESHNFDFFKRIFSTLKIKLKDNRSNEINDDSALEAYDDENNDVDIDNNNNDNNDTNNNDTNNNDTNNNDNNMNNNNENNINDNLINLLAIASDEENDPDFELDHVNIRIHAMSDNDYDENDHHIPLQIRADLLMDDDNKEDSDDEFFMMNDQDISTLIIQAICNDDDKLMEFIDGNIFKIDFFKEIYISDTVQYDVIQLSVIYGAIRCLKYITSRRDFKVSLCNKNDYSILRLAILFNQSEVLQFLLSFKGLNINSTEKEGGSAFTAATWDNQIPLVKILYKHGGVDINMKGKLGETPLTGTVLQNTPKMMELLLSYPEINVYEVNKDNKTAMMLCLEHSSVDCFLTLVQCEKFDINSPQSCFDCSTAKFCLLSERVPIEMIKLVIEAPKINLKEIYNGDTIENHLRKKISNKKDDPKEK